MPNVWENQIIRPSHRTDQSRADSSIEQGQHCKNTAHSRLRLRTSWMFMRPSTTVQRVAKPTRRVQCRFFRQCGERAKEALCSGQPAERKLHMRAPEPSSAAFRRLDETTHGFCDIGAEDPLGSVWTRRDRSSSEIRLDRLVVHHLTNGVSTMKLWVNDETIHKNTVLKVD